MRRMIPVLLGMSVSILIVLPVAAQTSAIPGTHYRLDDGSSFQRGCFDPCECPLGAAVPIRGTFRLTPSHSDPLFAYYSVTDVHWTVSQLNGTSLQISGSGTYKIGGEVAITQELSLDLVVGNDPVQHFDSGVVATSVPFPLLDVTISIHGVYCYDTVIHVRAKPFPRIDLEPNAIGWDPDPPASLYDAVRGDLEALRATGGDYRAATEECVANDLGGYWTPLTLSPAPGGAYWFLVRAKGGSYDAWDSTLAAPRDAGINAAPASCP